MAEHHLETPVTDEVIEKLEAGDRVFITGFLYTGRDSATSLEKSYIRG